MTATTPTLDTETINQFKEIVREEWADPVTVDAWSKWSEQWSVQGAELTRVLVEATDITPGMHVLDLASGTGDPLLQLSRLVGPAGHVTATDLSDDMLAVARRRAEEKGLHNITYRQADAHDLPFADNSFDRVTCRMGVMYFVDVQRALGEIRRVLKPGGRVGFVAWGAFADNPYMVCSLGPLFKRVQVPPPPPGAPTPFKYAEPGSLTAEMHEADFRQIEEETQQLAFTWPGPPEQLWSNFQDVAAPFRPIIQGLSPAERAAATAEVLDGYRRFYDGHQINLTASMVLASGVK